MQTAKLGILLLGCFLLAACGGTGEKSSLSANSNTNTVATTVTTAPAKNEADACSLMTKADVEAVIGKAVEGGDGNPDMNSATSCQYKVHGKPFDGVVLTIYYGQGSEIDSSMMKDWENEGAIKPIAGVGDNAFKEVKLSGRLHVRYHNDYFTINTYGEDMDDAAILETEKALAKKMIARL